ncbi:MAG TPA: hypothetical protein VF406_20530 [Thermodesulfobacteriota bacterium]
MHGDRAFQAARPVPGGRAISVALRTAHIAAFGFLLGGHAFDAPEAALRTPLWVAVLTGAGLIALEVRAIGLRWCVLGKGIGVAAKLVVLLLVPFFWEARVPLLLLAMAIASVSSHMPARFRHYSIVERRVIGAVSQRP